MKRLQSWPRWSFWTWCCTLLMAGGAGAYYLRTVHALGPTAHLRDVFPWGVEVGLSVLCGLALCAGGFAVAATVRILKLENYESIVRPCLLIGFLGYLVAFVGFITDAGQPYRIGLLITWNPRLVLAGAVWSLILYGAVLALEFAPELYKRLGWREPPPLRWLGMPLLLLAVVLSVLHQTSMADLLLGTPNKISALWFTPQLPFLFFVSAACAAIAAVIFASWHTSIAFARGLPANLVAGMGKALAALLFFYLGLRFADSISRGIPLLVQKNDLQSVLFGLEIGLFFMPLWLLITERDPVNPRVVYYSAVMVLAALITNRLNTCITSVEATTGARYLPSWNEFLIAYGVIALGVAVFSLTAKRLPVFLES
ncbi:MAG: Ni/Fe-hydrogenase cytochrome b subunit [Acidobacteriia bacterium]|nr:Ni/Fe-hydrogenase cytochrome b subunit [Terriglobia bacterium]